MTRGAALRWTGCAAFVLMAHAAIALALADRDDVEDAETGVAIPIVEFAPELAAPSGPLNDTIEEDAPPPEPEAQMASEPKPEEKQPEQAPPDPEAPPEPTKPPEPIPPREQAAPPQDPAESAQIAVPEPVIQKATPAAPAIGSEEKHDPAKIAQWQRGLVQRLQRAKRFPKGARGASGTVRLAFSIDRQGRLTSRRVLSSSGSDDLDREALNLLERAQPFPAPPAGVNDRELLFVLPVHYSARR